MRIAQFITRSFFLFLALTLAGHTVLEAKEMGHKKRSHAPSASHDASVLRVAFKSFLPKETIEVTRVNPHTIALSGNVSSADAATKAVALAKHSLGAGGEVLNFMQIKTSQQVMLRVRVGEIQRAALKEIGFNLQGDKRIHNLSLPFATNRGVSEATVSPTAFGTLGAIFKSGPLDLSASLDLLEQNGLLKMLAEPNLVAISGESAEFLAGGEFPIPVAQHNDTMSVEYKPFGVKVSFTPLVLAPNRIRLNVEPEVSEISILPSHGAVSIKDFKIPAITSRRAKTTVELAPGESFMIAGLIKDDMRNSINQVPGLGDVPVLSALFRSSSFQRNETELVIAVTPYLVDPVASSDIRLPTDNFQSPSVLDNMFFGALGARSTTDSSSQPGLEGPAGYIAE